MLLLTTALAGDPATPLPTEPVVTLPEHPAGPPLRQCLTDPSPREASGRIVFELRIRRGKVAVISTATTDPRLEAYRPCFERELVAWDWGVRRATIEVPVEVAPEPTK